MKPSTRYIIEGVSVSGSDTASFLPPHPQPTTDNGAAVLTATAELRGYSVDVANLSDFLSWKLANLTRVVLAPAIELIEGRYDCMRYSTGYFVDYQIFEWPVYGDVPPAISNDDDSEVGLFVDGCFVLFQEVVERLLFL